MPDYKDKLNYSAQKAIFENIDWNTLQFDDRRLKSPLTPEEERQEESYEPWRDRYWSEVDRKYNKWKVDTGSDFLNAIANGVSRFVSGLTSPLTMKDDDVNYKDEVEFKVNDHNSPIGSTYDIYKTAIYQYKDFIDELSEEFIKTGYYNFDISDNGKNIATTDGRKHYIQFRTKGAGHGAGKIFSKKYNRYISEQSYAIYLTKYGLKELLKYAR